MVSVTAIPVAYGDSLLIEYGRGRTTHRMLVDGGPASTYQAVRGTLSKLSAAKRRLDLFAITHIDADHIDGAILLLQELQTLGVSVEDVWFNGWAHINDSAEQQQRVQEDIYGAAQGEFLGALIQQSGVRWNAAFSSGPVVVPEDGPLPRCELAGGAVLTVVSPQPRQLRRLRRNWESVAKDAGWVPGDSSAALTRLAARKDYEPPPRIEVFGSEEYVSDNSVANGSSIGFVLEFGGLTCLFTGDATPPVLTDGLRRLATERGVSAVQFDLVKLAHHGSDANIDPELAALMPSPRYLVSTNGARYRHPNAKAINLLISKFKPELYFNYASDTTAAWADEGDQKARGYRAFYPPGNGPPGITVTLGR
jgi:beta-lactamase superfamily II metal-dependent hydrolase